METVADLVKLAIGNEVRASTFYRKALEVAGDGEAQMVFLELVEMEDGHARLLVDRFGAVLREAGIDGGELLAELEAGTDAVLSEGEEAALADADMRSVVEFAIRMEEGARDNYRALAEDLRDLELIDFCRELAQEEQGHYDLLDRLRTSMDTPDEERPAL